MTNKLRGEKKFPSRLEVIVKRTFVTVSNADDTGG